MNTHQKVITFTAAFTFILSAGGLLLSQKAEAASPSFSCLNPPQVTYDTPGDTPITSQDGINCFAWQTFIGLNWQVDTAQAGQPAKDIKASQFGEPGIQQTNVWETYANLKSVMRPNAQTPIEWGDTQVPSACTQAFSKHSQKSGPIRFMSSSRTAGNFNLQSDAAQAFPSNNPNWLADKAGNIVYYEILMGRDEYDFIKTNQLYNQTKQIEFLENNNNIAMPLGHDTTQGGLEIKAAWLHVPNPTDAKWKRFKTTTAYIYDGKKNTCNPQTMALVGMHIIHKTASQPQWVWATFEHVDNAPNSSIIKADGTVQGDYTFYNNTCQEIDVPTGSVAKVLNGVTSVKTSCKPNISPAYSLYNAETNKFFPSYPIRVSRDFAIVDRTDNHVASLNEAVKQLIVKENPNSVFANYILVNVLWSSAAVNDNVPTGHPPTAPLSISGETPPLSTVPVANTTLETYAQGFNCLSCHANAAVSSSAGAPKKYATDYSFIFGFAEKPATK